MKDRCIVIPANKKNPFIPNYLTKKLAGRALVDRALDIARSCSSNQDIFVLTDDEEISLISERANVKSVSAINAGEDSIPPLRRLLDDLCVLYSHCIILDPASPLITWVDVEKAWRQYLHEHAERLVTVRELREKIWNPQCSGMGGIMGPTGTARQPEKILVESSALSILNLSALRNAESMKTIPFRMSKRALEILDYHDWWICERLLERRHVVFVVAGYPAIGMGHVYRALMLAHEISSHRITFVCTRESELAVEQVASRDYHVVRQGGESLEETVIAQNPDLVVNDFLNTGSAYIKALKHFGAKCVNFEDEGSGAYDADLVINALYESPVDINTAHWRCGPAYFCLRDEFVQAARNPLRPAVKVLLISFGGTDQHNTTLRVLNLVEPVCRAYGISIRIVAGPGYAHKKRLEKRLAELANPLIEFTWATNIMSRMMEGADLAICSAGRTVYELAHMRVPGIVLATHDREARHRFARPAHGFAFAGMMDKISDGRIRNMFLAMLKQERRARYWHRQNALNFSANKARVVGLLQDQLEKSESA